MSNPPENEEMDQSQGAGPEETGAGTPTDAARWSRRRFGKAALVATPVLATLYGRPLMAQHNCTPSGWVSGNTSLQHDDQLCGGKTPGYWQSKNSKRQHAGWKAIHLELLNSGAGFPGFPTYYVSDDGSSTRPATLDDAVQGPGQFPFVGTTEMERQLIRSGTAALLNAKFLSYPLTEAQVQEILGSALFGGGYTTASGDFLTPEQVKDFFQSTMDLP